MLQQSSGRVLLTGMGASYFAAMPAAQAMESRSFRVLYAEASELLHFGQGSWRKEDVAILISRSGGSVETMELAHRLRQAHVPVIAVTNVAGSPLTEAANITVLTASASDHLIAVQTYTGTLLTLLLLAEQASTRHEPSLARQASSLGQVLAEFIDRSLDASDGRSFSPVPTRCIFWGRGSALAAVNEGALLFHETAKAPAIVMSSGQFRHGPVEVVTREFRAVVLGSPEATRALDWQLARDLRTMGASVRWIGPEPGAVVGAAQVKKLVAWPEGVPPALRPIVEIVPLQVAAYRTALWRGVRPGDFRYAAEITDKETGFALLQASSA